MIVSNLTFPSNTIPSNFFALFYYNRLILFNSCMYCTNFDSTAEIAIPTETPTNEVNVEIETKLLIAELKTRKSAK